MAPRLSCIIHVCPGGCGGRQTVGAWRRGRWEQLLMLLVFVFSSLSPSDLFPRTLRTELIQPYALKALFPTIVWLQLSWELCTRDYSAVPEGKEA